MQKREIEHILPQTPTEELAAKFEAEYPNEDYFANVYSLGNLTFSRNSLFPGPDQSLKARLHVITPFTGART